MRDGLRGLSPPRSPGIQQHTLPLEQVITEQLRRLQVRHDDTIVVGVSGGSDSVALLLLLAALHPPEQLVVAHFNHQLRGDAANQDERFVVELADRRNLRSVVERRGDRSFGEGAESLEESARRARYDFLERAATGCGARWIAVGHTADDQAETILHHLLRGSGLRGLAGIPESRPIRTGSAIQIVRPVLELSRKKLEDWLRGQGAVWRTDESNASPEFTRNRIRGELIPHLTAHYQSDLVSILQRMGRQCREASEFLRAEAERLLDRAILDEQDGAVRLSAEVLISAAPILIREAMVALWSRRDWPRQAMTAIHWERLEAVVKTEGAAADFPSRIRAIHRGGLVAIESRSAR
jgi:tRNA(Ile)-lysidine synthase